MKKIIKTLLAISCLLYFSHGQTFNCPSIDGYDIKNLTIPDIWQFDLDSEYCVDKNPNSSCHFYFTFCKFLPKTENSSCVNSSVCQYTTDSSAPIELGHYVENPFSVKEINGFFASFNGAQISSKGKLCNVSIIMEFDCNKNQPWISQGSRSLAPNPTDKNFDPFSCQFYIKFDYAGACHRIVPPTTTALNPTPAKICIPPPGYDITILTLAPYWIFNIPDGCMIESNFTDSCTLYMSFCKPIEGLIDCIGSSGCIRYPNLPGTTLIVANYSEDPFTAFEKNGFLAEYPAGEDIINRFTGKHCNVEIEVKFDCDKLAKWEIPPENQPGIGPEPIFFRSITNSSCQLKLTVPYSGACDKKSKNDDGSLSAGSTLVIIILIFAFVYLVLGTLYNTLIEKQTGINRIPNYSFWSSTALFAMEGFIFTWRIVSCQQKKDKLLKYDSI